MSAALLAFLLQLTGMIAGTDRQATLLFAGDAMMHAAQIDDARQVDGTYDYSACFDAVRDYIGAADYAVVNLETPLAGEPYTGYPCFSAPDSYAMALRDAGFDLMLTANNHTLDKRDRGLRRTLRALDALGVPHIGTYDNMAQRDTVMPAVVDINGFKVGFVNYTYGTNGISLTTDAVVDYIDMRRIKADIESARDAGAELIAACLHWGIEYDLVPDRAQIELADKLEALGVEMIVGGHPHVVQPMELHRHDGDLAQNRFRCYSLGNFISNMRTTDTRGGAVLRLTLRRDDKGRAYIDDAACALVFTLPSSQVAGAAVTMSRTSFAICPAETEMTPEWSERRDEFVGNAMRMFDRYNVNVSCMPVHSLFSSRYE